METFTPRSLIAGRASCKPGRELEAAFFAAAAVLGTERLALIHSRQSDGVCYLAAPAADLASHPQCTSVLAAALPGTPDHAGDGAYTVDLGAGLQAVVVKNGPILHSFVGTPALVKRFTVLEGAPTLHPCQGAGMPWQFPTALIGRREARLSIALTVSGLVVALASAAVWLWAASSRSHWEALSEGLRKDQTSAWATAVQSLEPAAYPKALAHLQKAVEQAIKEKGSLVQFEYKEGRSTWTLNVNSRPITGAAN